MSRQLTPTAAGDRDVVAALDAVADKTTSVLDYGAAFKRLGLLLGRKLLTTTDLRGRKICLGFTVEDADYLAEGMLRALNEAQAEVHLACFWNRRSHPFGVGWLDIATIVQEYVDPGLGQVDSLIVLKSIVSGSCVVRTNLMRLLEFIRPSTIHIVSPMSLVGAEERLAREFPSEVSSAFRYLTFAIDSTKNEDGNVDPGIGGEIYQRLGLGDHLTKNVYMPELIRRRQNDVYNIGAAHGRSS